MLWPIRSACHASELAVIITAARRAHSLDQFAIDRQRHSRNPCLFNRARQQPHRLVTELGCGNQEGSLHVVMLHPIDQLGHGCLNKARGVRNESAEAPEGGIKLADDSVRLKLEQTRKRNLCVHIFADKGLVITATSKPQLTRIDLGGDFAKRHIAVGVTGVERLSAIDVRAGRTDEREIQHGQSAARGREWRELVFDKRISSEIAVGTLLRFPRAISFAPLIYLFNNFHDLDPTKRDCFVCPDATRSRKRPNPQLSRHPSLSLSSGATNRTRRDADQPAKPDRSDPSSCAKRTS